MSCWGRSGGTKAGEWRFSSHGSGLLYNFWCNPCKKSRRVYQRRAWGFCPRKKTLQIIIIRSHHHQKSSSSSEVIFITGAESWGGNGSNTHIHDQQLPTAAHQRVVVLETMVPQIDAGQTPMSWKVNWEQDLVTIKKAAQSTPSASTIHTSRFSQALSMAGMGTQGQ